MTAARACVRCGADLTTRRQRRDLRWCSKECRTYYQREQRRMEARLKRPRCIICMSPIQYGKSGLVFKTRTCGNRDCIVKLNNWFTRYAASARTG
jgi:hypothetical protein